MSRRLSSNKELDRAMGREGCGIMNENRERLGEFCTLHNLVIGGTVFQKKDIPQTNMALSK